MTRRLPQLEAISDGWAARLRRIQTEDAPPEQIAEAQRGFTKADAEHEQTELLLARAREELAGLEAARTRNAEGASAAILSEIVTKLQEHRKDLFAAIAAKVAEEIAAMVETETKLHALGRDYSQWSRQYATEALQALQVSGS